MTRDKGVFKRKRRDEEAPPEHAGVDINDLGWLEQIRDEAEQEGDVAPRQKKIGRVRSHRNKSAAPDGADGAAGGSPGGQPSGGPAGRPRAADATAIIPPVAGSRPGVGPRPGALPAPGQPVPGKPGPGTPGSGQPGRARVPGVRPHQVSGPPQQVSGPPRQVSGPPGQVSSPPRQVSSPPRIGGVYPGPVSAPPGTTGRAGPVSAPPVTDSSTAPRISLDPLDPMSRPTGRLLAAAPPRGSGAKFSTEGVPKSHGRRAQLRDQFQDVGRLRLMAFGAIVLALLGVLPVAVAIREAGQDPTLDALHALELPAWAAERGSDQVSGNRWCIQECRYHERTLYSKRRIEETVPVYQRALRDAGWSPWKSATCPPPNTDGAGSCWQRDEYVLDLFVRGAICDIPAPGEESEPNPTGAQPDSCDVATQVTMKVFHRIAYPTRLS